MMVVDAARSLHIPRVRARLSDRERKGIRSGSVFVFLESESRIRRWTDGKTWSPSRIMGEFLMYKETDGNESVREDGLMKRTISLSVGSGEAFHVVAYHREHEKSMLMAATKHPFFKLSLPTQAKQQQEGKTMKQSEMTGHFRLSRRHNAAMSPSGRALLAPAPLASSHGDAINQAMESVDGEEQTHEHAHDNAGSWGVSTEDQLLFSHFLSSLHASASNSGTASLLGGERGERKLLQSDADMLMMASSALVTPRSLTPKIGLGE